MIKHYIYCSVLIIGNVEVGPDIGMKFHQEVMEIVSYDIQKKIVKVQMILVKLRINLAAVIAKNQVKKKFI